MKMLVEHVSCLCTEDEFEEAIKGGLPEIYVSVADGYLKHVKLSGGRHVRIKVDKLPTSTASTEKNFVSEELNFLPAGKIPYEFFEQIVEFFRQVLKKFKVSIEAHAWILWNKERGYFISVPKQKVSGASVLFTYDDDCLPPGSIIVCDLHSHGSSMNAFWSGTDEADDEKGIFYSGVIGKLTDTDFVHCIRFNLYKTKQKCTLEDVFDIPPKKVVVVPQDWLDQVDNKSQHQQFQQKLPQPFLRQPSLWDQRAGVNSPFGFQEIGPDWLEEANAINETANRLKGQGGNKKQSKKDERDMSDWPYSTGGEIYVPGPMDDLGMNDVPGRDDDLTGEYAQIFGKEAAESHELISDFLTNLEGCDEPLQDIISSAYALLTDKGQMTIAQNGLR